MEPLWAPFSTGSRWASGRGEEENVLTPSSPEPSSRVPDLISQKRKWLSTTSVTEQSSARRPPSGLLSSSIPVPAVFYLSALSGSANGKTNHVWRLMEPVGCPHTVGRVQLGNDHVDTHPAFRDERLCSSERSQRIEVIYSSMLSGCVLKGQRSRSAAASKRASAFQRNHRKWETRSRGAAPGNAMIDWKSARACFLQRCSPSDSVEVLPEGEQSGKEV